MAEALGNSPAMTGPTPRWRAPLRWLLLVGLVIVLGGIGGALSASGKPQLIAVFFGMVVVVLILASRTALIWFVLVGGLVVSGVAQLYFPQLKYIRYVVPLASAPLLLHAVMDYFLSWTRERPVSMPLTMRWALFFALTSFVSVLINLSDPAVPAVGVKGYFEMWGLFLSVAYIRWPETFGRNMVVGLVVIALLQLPFVAHEYLVIAPRRVAPGFVSVDIVSGTFGGILNGGGATMVLAVFQVIVVGLLLAFWKNGLLSGLVVAVAAPLLLSPMLVNEAKIIVLFLPLMFVVLFYRDIIAKPLKFLAAGAGLLGALALLMTALVTSQASSKIQSWSDLVDVVIERQTTDAGDRGENYGELTRWTSLTFWAKEHVAANPVYALLGHGPGASRSSAGGLDIVDTLAETRYGGMNIGYTGVSALLWDTGIVGLVTVLGMFAAAFFAANRLARHYHDTDRFRSALFEGLKPAIAVLTLSLASRDYFVSHIPFQTIIYLLLGFIVYSEINVVSDDGTRRRA